MALDQEKQILFEVMLITNPELAGGNWAVIALRLGLHPDGVR